jgi:hypothetical protein
MWCSWDNRQLIFHNRTNFGDFENLNFLCLKAGYISRLIRPHSFSNLFITLSSHFGYQVEKYRNEDRSTYYMYIWLFIFSLFQCLLQINGQWQRWNWQIMWRKCMYLRLKSLKSIFVEELSHLQPSPIPSPPGLRQAPAWCIRHHTLCLTCYLSQATSLRGPCNPHFYFGLFHLYVTADCSVYLTRCTNFDCGLFRLPD